MLSMLVVDLPAPAEGQEGKRRAVLGPAIPESWKGGKVKGLRIRGGGVVDFGWDDGGVVREVTVVESVGDVEFVNKEGDVLSAS